MAGSSCSSNFNSSAYIRQSRFATASGTFVTCRTSATCCYALCKLWTNGTRTISSPAVLFANSLRLIVSKARITVDCEGSTGSRGVLPLPPACVVWEPAEVEAWLAPRQISPSPSCALSMGGEGAHGRLRRRIGLEERHRSRNERRRGFCATGAMSGERAPRKKIVSFLSALDAVDQSVSGACAPWRCFRSRPSNTNGDSGGDFHPRTANRSRDRLHTA